MEAVSVTENATAASQLKLPALEKGAGANSRARQARPDGRGMAQASKLLNALGRSDANVLASTRKLSKLLSQSQLMALQRPGDSGTTASTTNDAPVPRRTSSTDSTAKAAAAVFKNAAPPVLSNSGWLAQILQPGMASSIPWSSALETSTIEESPDSPATSSLPTRTQQKPNLVMTRSGSASDATKGQGDGAPSKKYGILAQKLRSTVQATLLLGPMFRHTDPGADSEQVDKKNAAGFAEWKAKKQAVKEANESGANKERRKSVVSIPRRSSVFSTEDGDSGTRSDRPPVSREGSFGASGYSEARRKGQRNAVEGLGKMEIGATWNDDSITDYSPWIMTTPSVIPSPNIEIEVPHPSADPFKTVQAAVNVNKLMMKAKNLSRAIKTGDSHTTASDSATGKDPDTKAQDQGLGGRGRRTRSSTACFVVECKNLRGAFLGSVLDSKVVVSVAEEYISRKGKFYWVVAGQTEVVKGTTNPAFKQSIEVDFDPGQPRLVRCDIFSSEASLRVDPTVHKGSFLLDLQELLQAEQGKVQGGINPKPEVHEDPQHMQFDVVRQMRDNATPAELMAAFRKADKDRNRQLDREEFHHAVTDLARQKRFKITPEGEALAFSLCDYNGDGALNYSEFIAMVYGRHGSICVMLEKRHQSVEEACETQLSLYRRDLLKVKKARRGEVESGPETAAEGAGAQEESTGAELDKDEEQRADVKKAALRVREKAQVLLECTEKARIEWFLQQREARLQQYPTMHFPPIPRAIAPAAVAPLPTRVRPEGDTDSDGLHFIGHEERREFRTGWCRYHKGTGIVVANERGGSSATCNLLNETAGPCSVRTEAPLPPTGSYFFELVLERDCIQDGGSLDGRYSFGLATDKLQTWDGPWLEEDKEEFCCWAVSVCRPAHYDTSWSLVHKAPEVSVGEGGKSSTATFSLEWASFSRINSSGSAPRSKPRNPHDVVSFRAANALPRGTSYFEVTLKILGKVKGESLGGRCHIGLCTPAMQERGWTGDWTKDERAMEGWTLNDNHAGQLSMAMLGVNAQALSEKEINLRLREVFDALDLDKSGTIDKMELRQALRDLGIFCTDDELQEMFTVIDSSGDGSLDYAEFVLMARSRASTGSIVHGHPETWVLNSFFGVGDAIGVQVDTVRKTATLFKNGRMLGQAFSHLPDVLFPFVTLSQPGMMATLTVSSARSIASRSELVVGGLLKQWVEGSEFGCGDRVGLMVDMDSREVDMYKNGEHVGRAFDRIPDTVYPFVTLCHTGAVALLRWPPQPKPQVIERMDGWLSQCTVEAEGTIPCHSGTLHIGGHPGVTLTTRADGAGNSDVGRHVRVRAVDVASLHDDEVLGLKGCRIVSPLVEVALLHGPAFGARAQISIPHCSYGLDQLVIGYMAATTIQTVHRNVWQSLDGAVFNADVGTAPLTASGYFCVLCYQDPEGSKDVVEVSFDFQPAPGMPPFQSLSTLDGLRVPQFGVLRVGGQMEGTIHVAPKSCVDPTYAGTKGAVASLIGRGECFEPISGEGRCLDDEESYAFSQTEDFVGHGCTLSLQSLFVGQGIAWSGAPLDLRFRVRCMRLEPTDTYDRALWVRGNFSSARGDYEWHRRPFSFDYSNGVLYQLPLPPGSDDASGEQGQEPGSDQAGLASQRDTSRREIGRLPWMKVAKHTDPNTILPFAVQIYSSGGATAAGQEQVILAAATEADRDAWVVAIRCFDSLISGCPTTQLMSVQLSVSSAGRDTIETIHEPKPFAVLAPCSLSVMDHALKTAQRRAPA